LIVKGENGVNDIEEHINKYGGNVESISVYRRNVFEDYTQIRNDYLNADAIIFTSTMAAKIYFEKIYQSRVNTRFYSISNRIKSIIEEYGFEAITLDYFSDNLLEKIKTT
jgi:uroporphyrinogen-III synthase